jgi:hypothetical protein
MALPGILETGRPVKRRQCMDIDDMNSSVIPYNQLRFTPTLIFYARI